MVAVTDLVKQQQAKDKAAGKVVTWLERQLVVGLVRDKAVGFKGGGTEEVPDPRTGWPVLRERLIWLPRSQLRLVSGAFEPGAEVLVEVPAWLVRQHDL